MTYALDTNIVTALLKEDDSVNDNADYATMYGGVLILPPVVDYEVRRGLLAKRMHRKLREYLAFRQTVAVGVFGEMVWLKAADIYAMLSQKGSLIEDADIFIAAFCLANDYTLVTDNMRHFGRVAGLKLVNWVS